MKKLQIWEAKRSFENFDIPHKGVKEKGHLLSNIDKGKIWSMYLMFVLKFSCLL